MKRFTIIAVFLSLLFMSNANAENQSPTEYKIEHLQKQIDELKKDTQKSLDEKVEEKDIDNLKDRVGDINGGVDRFGIILALFGLLITSLLVLVGYIAYKNAKTEAKEEAKTTSQEVTKEWVEKEGKEELKIIILKLEEEAKNELSETMKKFEENFEQLVKTKTDEINQLFEKFKQEHKTQLDKHENDLKKFKETYTKEEKEVIDQNAKESENKDVKTFADYWNIIVQHYSNKAFKEMLEVSTEAESLGNLIDENKSYLSMAKGLAYRNLKEYDKALTAYQKAIEINPKYDDAYYNMGIAYRKLEEYDKAIEAYQKAIEINPKNDVAYYNMGIAYRKLEEYDKAIEAYQKAIEINPQKDEAYNNMGYAYFSKKEYNKAITAYQKAIEINPKQREAYTNMFELQLILNQDFNLEKPFLSHFGEDKEAMMRYEMLKVLRSISINKPYALTVELWSEKYRDIELDWGWDELDGWIATMPNGETKEKLVKAIKVFKSHKN